MREAVILHRCGSISRICAFSASRGQLSRRCGRLSVAFATSVARSEEQIVSSISTTSKHGIIRWLTLAHIPAHGHQTRCGCAESGYGWSRRTSFSASARDHQDRHRARARGAKGSLALINCHEGDS